ncbi:hypothetical protein BH23BAC4_BH23BAC4_08900 [soil metagenome]
MDKRRHGTFIPDTVTTNSMSFAIQQTAHDTVVIRIGKALDFRSAAEFKGACVQHARNGVRNFVLDFTGTGILDSTGLGAIFSLYRQLTPEGGQVVFASVSRPVQVVVQLTRTYKVFRQYPTVQAATEALQAMPTAAASRSTLSTGAGAS